MRRKQMKNDALKHIRVSKYDDNEWSFEYPRLTIEAIERLDESIDIQHSGNIADAKANFHELIREFPEFIDAYHHLALLMDDSGQPYESFHMVKTAVDIGLSSLPYNFYLGRDLLPWNTIENRPFLRAYHYFGLKLFGIGEIEKAICVFNNILDINPDDNQGVRALAIGCYLSLKRPLDVLQVVKKYPGDILADTLYGKTLALYQLERIKEAKRALKDAVKILPLVAAEIPKKQHRKSKGVNFRFITLGGEDEAYYFWQRHAHYWKETPGAIDFVREYLSDKGGVKGASTV